MKRKTLFASAMAIFAGAMIAPIWQARGRTEMPSSSSNDNTARNKRYRSGDSLTRVRRSEAKSDIDLVARTRREINKDDALSMIAKNINISAIDGRVTLRGPVRTEREKLDIEARAAAIAGSTNIDDRLEIAAQ